MDRDRYRLGDIWIESAVVVVHQLEHDCVVAWLQVVERNRIGRRPASIEITVQEHQNLPLVRCIGLVNQTRLDYLKVSHSKGNNERLWDEATWIEQTGRRQNGERWLRRLGVS